VSRSGSAGRISAINFLDGAELANGVARFLIVNRPGTARGWGVIDGSATEAESVMP